MNNSTEVSLPDEGPDSLPGSRHQEWGNLMGANALWKIVLIFVAWGIFIPLVPIQVRHISPLVPLSAYIAATVAFMFLQLCLLWSIVAYDRESSRGWQIAVAGIIVWIGLMWATTLLGNGVLHNVSKTILLLRIANPLTNLACSIGLGFAGARLSRFVKEAKILLPITVVAGVIDVIGAMSNIGLTKHIIKTLPAVVPKFSVNPPTFGHLPPIATVGPGDILFLCFFFSIVHRFSMNRRATFWVTDVLLTLTLLLVSLGPPDLTIAALLPMGIGMVIANFRYFKYTREETFAMIYAGIIVLVGAVIFFLMTNRYIFNHK